MEVYIEHYISKHECETCGDEWHDIYTVSGALGDFVEGEGAYCFGTTDGDFYKVVDFLMDALKKKGHEVHAPDQSVLDELVVDWEAYHAGVDAGVYDWENNVPDDVRQYDTNNQLVADFYSTGWKEVLNFFGYELVESFDEDEDWDYGDDDY